MKYFLPLLLLASFLRPTQSAIPLPEPYLYFGIADNFIVTLPSVYNITKVLKPVAVITPIQPLLGCGIKVRGVQDVQNGYLGIELLFNKLRPATHTYQSLNHTLGVLAFGLYKNYFLHYYNFSLGASFKVGTMNPQYLNNTYADKLVMDKWQETMRDAQRLGSYLNQNGIINTMAKLELLTYDRDQKRNYNDFLRKVQETNVFSLAINIFMRPFQNFTLLRHFCFEIECGPVFIMPQTAPLQDKLWKNWQNFTTVLKSISIINCYINLKVYGSEV